MAEGAVRVEGLQDLNRAFKRLGGDLNKQLKGDLADAARPVADAAEGLAVAKIRNLHEGDPWSEMRVGVTTKVVYVAPVKRGLRRGKRKRPNLANLLLERAMEPALEQEKDKVIDELGRTLDKLAGKF